MLDRYRSPDDLPTDLPVFPLRGVILLPRTALPLNIFEPRYLQMLDDALSGDRIIGMIQPVSVPGENDDDEDEEKQSPLSKTIPLRRIGCAGRITAFQETDEGRVLITLTGISRFQIENEQATIAPYRICDVNFDKFADDFGQGSGEEDVDREHLLAVLKSYLNANELKADWQNIYRSSSEFLVNTLSMISPYGAEEKQALLEASDLRTRAEILIALAEMELASNDDGSGSTLQ